MAYAQIAIAFLTLVWLVAWLLSTSTRDNKCVVLRPRLYGIKSILMFTTCATLTIALCAKTNNAILISIAFLLCIVVWSICISASTTRMSISKDGIAVESIVSMKSSAENALYLFGCNRDYIYFPDLSFHSFSSNDVTNEIDKYKISIHEDIENTEYVIPHLLRIFLRCIKLLFWFFSSAFFMSFVDRRNTNHKDMK